MLRDAQYFKDRMVKLDANGEASDEIVKAVKEKAIGGDSTAATNGEKTKTEGEVDAKGESSSSTGESKQEAKA